MSPSPEEPAPAARRVWLGKTLLGLQISRRQFVVLAGGGAAAVAVAGGNAIPATRQGPANGSLWAVRVVRAGRGARLRADGSPVFQVAPGPLVFTNTASRAVSTPASGSSGHTPHQVANPDAHQGGHANGGSLPATSYPQPYNLTWGDVVVLEVDVRNTAAAATLFSPGQLRLRLASGPTITPQDASRGPKAIAAGASELVWVSYLAPSDGADFSVEFTDPLRDGQLALGIPGLVSAKA